MIKDILPPDKDVKCGMILTATMQDTVENKPALVDNLVCSAKKDDQTPDDFEVLDMYEMSSPDKPTTIYLGDDKDKLKDKGKPDTDVMVTYKAPDSECMPEEKTLAELLGNDDDLKESAAKNAGVMDFFVVQYLTR
eukprot:UN27440